MNFIIYHLGFMIAQKFKDVNNYLMIIIKYYSYIVIQTLVSKQQFEWAGYFTFCFISL